MKDLIGIGQLAAAIATVTASIIAFFTFLQIKRNNKESSIKYSESMKPFLALENIIGHPVFWTNSLRMKNTGVTPARDIVIRTKEVVLDEEYEKSISDVKNFEEIKEVSVVSFKGLKREKKINYLAPNGEIEFLFLTTDIRTQLLAQKQREIEFYIYYTDSYGNKNKEVINMDIEDSLDLMVKSKDKELDPFMVKLSRNMRSIDKSLAGFLNVIDPYSEKRKPKHPFKNPSKVRKYIESKHSRFPLRKKQSKSKKKQPKG